MGRRVLDWNGLVRVADRRNPPDRLIFLHQLPARVVPHLATVAGFYVRTANEDDGADYWSLRSSAEMVLLRELVAAGAVSIEDPEVAEGCFLTGCTAPGIDQRGPVHTTDGRIYRACPDHWLAIFSIIGAQDPAREDAGRDDTERTP